MPKQKSLKKLTLIFKHGMAPYQAGETATFNMDYALRIVNSGYAAIVGQDTVSTKQKPGGAENGPAGYFESMHIFELRKLAKDSGLKFDARTKKVDLITMLRGEK